MLAEIQLEQYYADMEILQDMQDELADWPESQKDEDVICVLAWSQSQIDNDGNFDGTVGHYVAGIDDYGEPVEPIYGPYASRKRAEALAQTIASQKELDVEFYLFG